MKINSEKLKGLSVETKSGQVLGKLDSFNLETDSQSILEYIIKPSNLVKDLITKDLIIPRGQVIEITSQKIIVEDNVAGDEVNVKGKSKVKEKVVSGVAMKGSK